MSRSIDDSIPLTLCLEEFQKCFGRFPSQCCQGRKLRARFRWCQAGSKGV